MKRCNYCQKPAANEFSWQSWYSRQGSRRAMTIYARSCDEHLGCVNWESLRALHPEALVTRIEPR